MIKHYSESNLELSVGKPFFATTLLLWLFNSTSVAIMLFLSFINNPFLEIYLKISNPIYTSTETILGNRRNPILKKNK